MSQLLKLTLNSGTLDADVSLYTLEHRPGQAFLQVEDYATEEFAEAPLDRSEALQLGLALVNWAGGTS